MTRTECLDNQSCALLVRDNMVCSPWGICDQQAAEACCKTAGNIASGLRDHSAPKVFFEAYGVVDNRQCSGACGHVATLTLNSMFCTGKSDDAVKSSFGDSIYSLVFGISYLMELSKGCLVERPGMPIPRRSVTVEQSASAQRGAKASSGACFLSISLP